MSIKVEHYKNGQIKRLVILDKNGNRHNPDGPTVQAWYADGQEEYREYYLNGTLHNPDGPAVQRWYEDGQEECRSYWAHGNLHNPDGPASQAWYEDGQEEYRDYYLRGKEITEAEFNRKRKKGTVLVTCNGKEVRISKQSAEAMNLI